MKGAPNETEKGGGSEVASGSVLPILDGAASRSLQLPPELEAELAIARDRGCGLDERLEAFENVFESEVGDTRLARARNIERETGMRQLYLKFDGGNPTGTQKDRIAFAQAMDSLRRGFETVTAATCGNYGAALALAASFANLRCEVYVPSGYQVRRAQEIRRHGAEIIVVEGDYEAAVEKSRIEAEARELYDANPGGANTSIQLRAYGEIAYEIYDELRDAPAAVAVPVSNGTTLAGVYRGFQSLYRRGKTSHVPRMIAGSSYKKNPIVQSFLSGSESCQDLDPAKIHETVVNEPLINWHSIDGDLALEAIRSTSGWASYASDRAMSKYSRLISTSEGLSVMPASAAGLIALLDEGRRQELPNDRYVVVLTGRR
ncbi:MAG: pyridoxal-phosphate dependent enzyme [Acidobacteriota bacterium]|jgi:threonine synthase|nr:pyridoxal-phosphate dependent enzyme [Acidobacteriota bacterium]